MSSPSQLHPPGPIDYSNQRSALVIIIFFPALATLVLGLRLYTRWFITRQWGWDDVFIVAAWVLVVPETYTTWMYIKTNYVGIHVWQIPPDHDVELGQKYNFANQLLYNPILALVKASFLIFLLRIVGKRKGPKILIWVIFGLNLLLMALILFVDAFQCTPVAFVYDFTIDGGHCIHQGAFFVGTAAITIFTDFLVLIVPTWITVGLKMPIRKKIAVISLLSLGLVVTGVGIYRLVILVQAFFPTSPNPDPTYSIGFCASAVEVNVAIMTACGPPLKPFFVRYFPRFLGSSTYGRYGNYYGRNRQTGYGNGSRNIHISNPARPDVHARGPNAGTGYEMNIVAAGNGKVSNKVSASSGGDYGDDDSEQEIMDYNGIMKTMNVSVNYAGVSEVDLTGGTTIRGGGGPLDGDHRQREGWYSGSESGAFGHEPKVSGERVV